MSGVVPHLTAVEVRAMTENSNSSSLNNKTNDNKNNNNTSSASKPSAESKESTSIQSVNTRLNPGFTFHNLPLQTQFRQMEKEFLTIDMETMDPRQYNFTSSIRNMNKNRYMNILANEHTLYPPLPSNYKPPSSHLYINGNTITYPGVQQTFVACQAPTFACTSDFLDVLLRREIDVVLMVTQEVEASVSKADRYWPEDEAAVGKVEAFGNMLVWKDKKDVYTFNKEYQIVRRPFFIKREEASDTEAHRVVQIQYCGWPDHGVPDSTGSFEALLNIVDECVEAHKDTPPVRPTASFGSVSSSTATAGPTSFLTASGSHSLPSSLSPSAGGVMGADPASSSPPAAGSASPLIPPIVVHCSAGVGRTGTFIGAYFAIELMRAGQLTDATIPTIVRSLRSQRYGMVQRVEQYMYLYRIVLEYLGLPTLDFAVTLKKKAQEFQMRLLAAQQQR